ncbi:hypothetical protein SAMN03080615_03700 [Amphritea atlantica]|uniref:Uncharacterized protein n=1 Tax=Amphritea atlantica TaxID=355243 RepID=A0A1H9KZ22_9GAMM|nr:hypothetical protein [Amphritea atlantica]SER04318.1 hypothetical protein SAMN03080615_03700 [Amphritea atlantica]
MVISVVSFRSRLAILPLLLVLFALSGCSDEQQGDTPTIIYEQLEPSNQQAFIQQMVTRYLMLSDRLQQQYLAYKAANDADGFILFRNNEWTPEYIEYKTHYDQVFYEQKAYIYRHQLDGLFDLFFGLHKLSVHLKHSLLEKDWKLEQQVLQKLTADQAAINRYLLVTP